MLSAILVCVSAVGCLLVAEWANAPIVKAAAKMSAASAFLALALAGGALASTFGLILFGGLALCWIGDACLLSEGQSTGFLAGIGAFLLAHLAYAAAFFRLGFDPIGFAIGGLGILGLAVLSLRWLRPHVPDSFQIAVTSYVVVISLMVATSIGAAFAGAPLLIVLGAVVFAISDVFVARQRFVTKGFVNAAIGLPTYFGSQLMLAYSASLGSIV